jgi:hypothetical protein
VLCVVLSMDVHVGWPHEHRGKKIVFLCLFPPRKSVWFKNFNYYLLFNFTFHFELFWLCIIYCFEVTSLQYCGQHSAHVCCIPPSLGKPVSQFCQKTFMFNSGSKYSKWRCRLRLLPNVKYVLYSFSAMVIGGGKAYQVSWQINFRWIFWWKSWCNYYERWNDYTSGVKYIRMAAQSSMTRNSVGGADYLGCKV